MYPDIDIYLKLYLTRQYIRQIQSYISNITCRTSETGKDILKISASITNKSCVCLGDSEKHHSNYLRLYFKIMQSFFLLLFRCYYVSQLHYLKLSRGFVFISNRMLYIFPLEIMGNRHKACIYIEKLGFRKAHTCVYKFIKPHLILRAGLRDQEKRDKATGKGLD